VVHSAQGRSNWGRELSGDRKLNRQQQKLFDDHVWIAEREVRVWLRRQGKKFFPREEVRQAALTGLWKAAFLWRAELAKCEFGAFATRQVRWGINGCFFGDHAGSAASRDAALHEMQGSMPIAKLEDKETTVMDFAADRFADQELSSNHGELRLASRLHDVREAIRRPGLLLRREARILRLRYIDGEELEVIAKRIGYSVPVVKRTLRAGVRKLRVHFGSLGFDVLPLDTPLQNDGNRSGCPASNRRAGCIEVVDLQNAGNY
jgi:hypothetical protein